MAPSTRAHSFFCSHLFMCTSYKRENETAFCVVCNISGRFCLFPWVHTDTRASLFRLQRGEPLAHTLLSPAHKSFATSIYTMQFARTEIYNIKNLLSENQTKRARVCVFLLGAV